VAELHFFTGTMDSGKSTLALQTNHNRAARGLVGRIFTARDRAGEALVSSRLGLTNDAIAEELGIGARTVKTRMQSLLTKLDVPDRTAAVARALRLGLIS
jgi:DNA-binding NarL/FixJ family response regulator